MNWFFPKNDTSTGKKVVITAVYVRDSDSRREVQGVELQIGNEDKMLEDCERICMTRKEWIELKRKINKIL